jgi:hypothetical protein
LFIGLPTALGYTAPEIIIDSLGPLHLGTIEKTLFSMVTPEVKSILNANTHIKSVVLVGIEVGGSQNIFLESNLSHRSIVLQSHVCVFQTALDLLELKYDVHVLADGVSSSNPEEVPIALAGIRQAGGHITTSECAAFQLQRKMPLYPHCMTELTVIMIYFCRRLVKTYFQDLLGHH